MELRRDSSGRAALRTMQGNRKFNSFSSFWNVGDRVSVFYPIQWVDTEDGGYWDIVTAQLYGYKVADLKRFPVGNTFIPSLTAVDDYGQPIGTPDITYQFSKIAPLFIKGRKQTDINQTMAKNYGNKEELRTQALKEIEDKYDTTKSMNKDIKPVIGKLGVYVSTELIAVKISPEGNYMTDTAQQCVQELSTERLSNLFAILDDSMYRPTDKSQKWLEIQYTFNANKNDKMEASRKASPTGLTKEYTMQVKSPKDFEFVQSKFLSNLPEDSAMISRRNFAYRKISEQSIKHVISSYISMNSEYLDVFANDGRDHEDELRLLERNVNLLVDMDVVNFFDEKLRNHLMEAYSNEEKPEVVETPRVEPTFEKMPTAADLLKDNVDLIMPEDEDDVIL